METRSGHQRKKTASMWPLDMIHWGVQKGKVNGRQRERRKFFTSLEIEGCGERPAILVILMPISISSSAHAIP